MEHVVIVGAGQAGASCAMALRRLGYEGRVTIVGEEDAAPYQRPPLSKAYLLGEVGLDRLYLRPPAFYEENDIRLRLGAPVRAIDLAAGRVELDGESLAYDHLVLATGATPHRLPAAMTQGLSGIYELRNVKHVHEIAPEIAPEIAAGRRALIVGGGYIGLEVAAVAAAKGVRVRLVEAEDRILKRVACAETADYFRDLHGGHGVEIGEGVRLSGLDGDGGRVARAALSDGTEADVDFVIVAIGVAPEVRLAEAAGVAVENGVRTDARGRTSAANVWAAGDCASFPYRGQRVRLESVPNANDQAEIVARNIMGQDVDYMARPWFWSDQYDVKLQIAGLNAGYDAVFARRDGAQTSFWYYRGEELLACDALNDPRAYMTAKRLVEAGRTADPDRVADPATPLKSLLG